LPTCGDGIVDDGEACDKGPTGSGECTSSCELVQPPSLGGCCSAERNASSSGALGVLTLGLVLRRRRRRQP
jgi:MYXO-CTERM domain-containing protein